MVNSEKKVVVSGEFDDIRSGQIRFLEEAAKWGRLHVLLWDDKLVEAIEEKPVKFPLAERQYFLQAVRYVHKVHVVNEHTNIDSPPIVSGVYPDMWVVTEEQDNEAKQSFCAKCGYAYRVLKRDDLAGFPERIVEPGSSGSLRKKVLATGCYDWFHSGHVRFFEEVSGLGDLYVVIGHDANVRELKGDGHPMLCQEERRYMVQSIRYVKQALISTGHGWMDAEPEIERIQPDIYVVNEDGDKPTKLEFCDRHGIEYVVLKRAPKDGLPKRDSTTLRGF
jgi:cytidyltransferase-like protein